MRYTTYTTYCRVAALALVALVGACKSDSSVGPSTPPPATLNQVFTEMSLPSLSGAVRGATPTTGTMGLMPPVPKGCSYDASIHGFVCPMFLETGVAVTQSYMLYDKAGNSQSQYDPASTDAVRIITTMAGTETSGTMSLMIDSRQDITLSGLQSGPHVLNGTTNMHVTGTQDVGLPTAGSIDDTVVATFANIVMPSGTEKWPQSGTITFDDASKATGLVGAISVHMVMTFNGTSKVPLTIGDGIFSSACTVDLTGQSIPSCTFP
jgi:hypothetical protein